MGQGQRLSDWQIETIRLAYAETGSYAHAAREAGCSLNGAKRWVLESLDDGLAELRAQKKADVIAQIAAVRLRLLEEMHGPSRLSKASLAELATAFGILTDKQQLLTGKATERHEIRDLSDFTDAQLDRLAKVAAEVVSGMREP